MCDTMEPRQEAGPRAGRSGEREGGRPRLRVLMRAMAWALGHIQALLVMLVVAVLAGVVLYSWGRSRIVAAVYRNRLEYARQEYERLRERHQRAVARTAITELVVRDGTVAVVIRTCEGAVATIPTPYSPDREIYIDYVVVDGRIWIRRVFDDATAPSRGIVIDPAFAHVDWQPGSADHGKAVYRSLDEGRWIVTVSGNGALGLDRAAAAAPPLVRAPEVARFEAVSEDADAMFGPVGFGDVLRAAVGLFKTGE